MDRARRTFIDRMGQATEADGLSPIAGRLFAALLLSEQPRSLDDLAEELAVSKASVSTEARRLLDRGIVDRVPTPGDRRDYYELTPDFYARVIRNRLERWRRIQSQVDAVRNESGELGPVVRDRIASIGDINADVITQVEAALASWEAQHEHVSSASSRRTA
jgi:DNA-binding transcriptional regulator GbsR (MarR family)